MTSPANAITPALFQLAGPITFIANNVTKAKILVDTSIMAPATNATAYQPSYYGGCSVLDITASTTGATMPTYVYLGTVGTVQDTTNTGVMATTNTTNSTVTRSTGSFITDGFRIGDNIMLFVPLTGTPDLAVDGLLSTVTNVSANTLTLNGVTVGSNTSLATGTRVVRVKTHFVANVQANSGANVTTVSTGMLNNPNDGGILRSEIKLGPNNMLMIAPTVNVAALPIYMSVSAQVALY